MHYLQQAHCLLLKSLGAQTPKPNKLYATILIIPQINMYCNSQFTKYKVFLFRNPTSKHTIIQSYSLLPIKLTKCTKSLSLFHHLLTTVLQCKSKHSVSIVLQSNLVEVALPFYYGGQNLVKNHHQVIKV